MVDLPIGWRRLDDSFFRTAMIGSLEQAERDAVGSPRVARVGVSFARE